MFKYLEEFSLTEQENIKKTIQELFRQTCILKIKMDPETLVPKDNHRYAVCNRHRKFIEDYLAVLDLELHHDSEEYIFYLGGEGVPTIRLSLTTTKLILLLKLIYREKIMGEGLHATTTSLKEIREFGKDTNLLPERLNLGDWKESLTVMRRHQMIEIPGAIANLEDDTPIYIYSTIHLYCPTKEISELINRYQEQEISGEEKTDDTGEESI